MVLLSGVAALAIGLLSGHASYEDRLVSIAAKRGMPPEVYAQVRDAPALQALLLDASGDRDVSVKMALGLEKYGNPAREVLEAYGTDPALQDQLRRYGENIIPVIAYFRAHDLITMRAIYRSQRIAAALRSAVHWRLWGRKSDVEPDPTPPSYSADTRGLWAIERIQDDGHGFLGQFDIDAKGVAQWNQTERVLKGVETFLFGGVRNLDRKNALGASLKASDYAWAGVDVLGVASAAKALKFLKVARGSAVVAEGAEGAEGAGIVEPTRLLGGRGFAHEKVGRYVVRLGVKIGTGYMLIRHPGPWNSIAIGIEKLLGLSAWLSITLFWWVVVSVLLVLLLPLLRGLGLLATPLLAIARRARWLMPARARTLSGSAVT